MAARPLPTKPTPQRVVVVGCAGSGTTTLARALAIRLDARHIERDALGDDEAAGFAARVAAAVEAAGRRWVFDGAPYNAEPLVYPHADTIVALDYPRRVVLRRVVARSARLWLTRRTDRGPHRRLPAVALGGAHPPSRLGRPDARRPAHRDRRAVRPARARPHPPAAVHLTTSGHRLAGQPPPLTAVPPTAPHTLWSASRTPRSLTVCNRKDPGPQTGSTRSGVEVWRPAAAKPVVATVATAGTRSTASARPVTSARSKTLD
jgi:adenylate kinase family enzyme